ncbi:MAG TPA: DinB family protein [Fimbriimonadaceae bacterium]|nr:DinB family protein [Fimbriimonadaceae bacterium]
MSERRRLLDVPPVEGFGLEVGALLACLDESTAEWRENLGEPPVEAIVWQPAAGFHSIGGVLLHLIDVEAYWFETFAAGRARPPGEAEALMSESTHQYGVQWPVPPSEPIAWYLDLHDRVRSRVRRGLRDIDPQQVLARKHYDATLRWVVAHVAGHDAYHGGQAVLLHELWKKMK